MKGGKAPVLIAFGYGAYLAALPSGSSGSSSSSGSTVTFSLVSSGSTIGHRTARRPRADSWRGTASACRGLRRLLACTPSSSIAIMFPAD